MVGGLDLRSRETCTFLTFGKLPSTPRSAVVSPSTIGNSCVHSPATPASTNVGVCGTGNSRERKSSTETGPPDPSALRPGSGGSESSSRARCPSPDDDDDVFPVAHVGCSSIASSRSVSVPPRRTRSCAQSLVTSDAPASNAAIKISPPRMKRRKKKNVTDSSESESRKVVSSMSSGSNNAVLPVVSRRSNKASEVTKKHASDETNNNDNCESYKNRDGDCIPTELPASEQSVGRETSSTSMEAETKRKKNIRWKSDVAQSSPDVASDDADSKESGYITLEDLQAQLGLSSWSSDERQTDQDVFSSSGDELRAPEGLHGAQSTLSTSSAFGAPSTTALLLPPPSSSTSSSFLSPLVPPEQFDVLGGAVDCCRSAPPTCDASLVKFTFTVRLDSKMFHRRTANKAARRHPPLMMLTDARERERYETLRDCSKELCKPVDSHDDSSRTDNPATSAAVVENFSSPTVENQNSPPASKSFSDQQNTQVSTSATFTTATSPSPPDSAVMPSSNNVQPFAGEKVVVTADVHRSADQLDTDRPKTPNNLSATSNSQGSTTKSSAVHVGRSSKKEAARRTVNRDRTLMSSSCQPDDTIVSCSPDAELIDRQCSMTKSVHHDQVVDGGFNGRLNYVDVDKVVSQGGQRQTFDRQQSLTSAVSHRSIKKLSDGFTLTLRKPLKLRSSDRCTTDVKTLPRKKPSEASAGRSQRKTNDTATSSRVRSTTDAGPRATNRHLSCERAPGRIFSESSSLSSDSEPDICGPCIARDTTTTVTCSRGCPTKCSRHAGKPGILKSADGRPSKSTAEAASVTRSQSTRRALRQFFRVENLFACRQGRSGSDKYSTRDIEHQTIGCAEESSRAESAVDAGGRGVLVNGCEAAAMYRGRCGRSATQSTLRSDTPAPRTCRRSRHSRSSRRTDGGGGGATSTVSRSVSPHARSRCASRVADERRTLTAGTCGRAATRHRSRDRSSTVDRCRQAWNGVVDDSSTQPAANNDWNGRSGRRWNTLCVSPSDNSILTPDSGCGFSNRRRVLATTPISPSTPAPDNLHVVTLGKYNRSLLRHLFPFAAIFCSSSF